MNVINLPSFEGRLVTEEDRFFLTDIIAGDPLFPSVDDLIFTTDFSAHTYNISRIYRRKSDGEDVAWGMAHKCGSLMTVTHILVHPDYRNQGIVTQMRREYEQFVKLNYQNISQLGLNYEPNRIKSGNDFDNTNTERLQNRPYREYSRQVKQDYTTIMEIIETEDI